MGDRMISQQKETVEMNGRRKIAPWKLEQLLVLDPEHRPLYELAMGKTPSASVTKVLPEQPVTPTELGKKLSEYLPVDKPLKGSEVNNMLIELGLQRREYRDYSNRAFYVPTAVGESYSTVLQVNVPEASRDVTQVKWYPVRTIEFILRANSSSKS